MVENNAGFFVKETVTPVNSRSYDIKTCYDRYIYTYFCKNPLNKNLIEKAIANYNEIVESYDELSRMDEDIERKKTAFRKFQYYFRDFNHLLLFSRNGTLYYYDPSDTCSGALSYHF